MGRKSTVSDQKIFAAVSAQIAQGEEFRIQSLAEDTSVSIGSLYHRYGSREGLLAAAWLDAVQAFQTEFLTALQMPGVKAGERAALVTPRFSRNQRQRAIILCIGRRESLLHEKAPLAIRQAVNALNKESNSVLMDFAKRNAFDPQACLHGIVAFPLASVRLYLPRKQVPKSVDDFITAAYHSVIGIGVKSDK